MLPVPVPVISISIDRNLRNVAQVSNVGFNGSEERFTFKPIHRKLSYHPWVAERLNLKTNQFSRSKTIIIPSDREDVIQQYYNTTTKKFIFKNIVLKSTIKPPEDESSKPSQLKRKLDKLKFDSKMDDPEVFIKEFKDLTGAMGLDETAKKGEFFRFFKTEDRANLFRSLAQKSLEDLTTLFYAKYKDEPSRLKAYYENLKFSDCPSLERFLVDKIFYYKVYKGYTLSTIKINLLCELPNDLNNALNLNQPTLDRIPSVIYYICQRAEELRMNKVRKRDECSAVSDEIEMLNLEEPNLDELPPNIVKLTYPQRNNRY